MSMYLSSKTGGILWSECRAATGGGINAKEIPSCMQTRSLSIDSGENDFARYGKGTATFHQETVRLISPLPLLRLMLIDPAPTKVIGREELRKSLRLTGSRKGFGIDGSDTEDIALVNWCEDKNVKVGGRVLGGDGVASMVTVAYPKSSRVYGDVIAEGEVTMRLLVSREGGWCRDWRNGRCGLFWVFGEALEEWKERNIVAWLHEEEVGHSDEITIVGVSLGWRLAGIWWLMWGSGCWGNL
ncbi:hypothetical protein ARMGADRAFT_1038166 [Armillaria gallica]|uniref:Uncharacterized protein n=1 Tax=Armillaria gallica TaxID=47427 RepID=A0A2H3CIW3_ARMGA|nr:hypothetical protein ARMGADRAFT_1038166 [Armillaria gallica]